MGKKLPKPDLIREITQEREKLDQLLEQFTSRQMTRGGATQAGWSVKDILGHLISWQQLNLAWHQASHVGETPAVPAEGHGWKDVKLLNEQFYKTHRRRSLTAVLKDYKLYHAKMLELIDSLTHEQLVQIGHFDWTGSSWTASDYIRANTASHYRWACKHLRRWLKILQAE